MKFSNFFGKIFLIDFMRNKYIVFYDKFLNDENSVRKVLLLASLVCFSAVAVLIIWSFVSKINFLEETYKEYIFWLSELEYKIGSIRNKWLLALVVMLLYFIKSAFPFYPVSIICVASAMVFDLPECLCLNIAGAALLLSVRYATGINDGGGKTHRFIKKHRFIRNLLESEGTGNSWLLFLFRLLPVFPVNTVSRLYGAMRFPFFKYIFISVSGFLPKTVSYIVIGRNVFNPFSLRFSLPLIVLTALTGTALLMMRAVYKINDNKQGEIHNV